MGKYSTTSLTEHVLVSSSTTEISQRKGMCHCIMPYKLGVRFTHSLLCLI